MLSKDIGIDLGTANVLIYIKGEGIVLNEPSIVALETETRKVLAVGSEANEMLGRTPGKIKAIKPLKDGVIADFEVTEIMLDAFINKVKGRNLFSRPRILICCPTNITPIERNAIREAAESGILAGYPVIDFKATLVDGSYHEVDSSEMAFKIAGSMAFKEGCKQAKSVILEPIMKVEITVPEEYMGDVIGDVNSRRGRLEGMEAQSGNQVIRSFIPLSEIFGYATDLRSKTQGRGTYSMEPSHYEEVPKSILDTIVASKAKKED